VQAGDELRRLTSSVSDDQPIPRVGVSSEVQGPPERFGRSQTNRHCTRPAAKLCPGSDFGIGIARAWRPSGLCSAFQFLLRQNRSSWDRVGRAIDRAERGLVLPTPRPLASMMLYARRIERAPLLEHRPKCARMRTRRQACSNSYVDGAIGQANNRIAPSAMRGMIAPQRLRQPYGDCFIFRPESSSLAGSNTGNQQGHAFWLALIRDPRFAAIVNDIVVESGNGRLSRCDRSVRSRRGRPDGCAEASPGNHASPGAGESLTEEFFRAVRDRSRLKCGMSSEPAAAYPKRPDQ